MSFDNLHTSARRVRFTPVPRIFEIFRRVRWGLVTESIRTALTRIDGVLESGSRYKPDLAYWVNGTEIAHFESDRLLDVRLTRAVIRAHRSTLRTDPAVLLRPGSSDWITVDVGGPEGLARAVHLVELAAAAHRAPPGSTPRPPGRARS
jgi:Luciferase